MLGCILGEPDLRIEHVPDRLLDWEAIRWPPDRNTMPEKPPGQPVAFINPAELYYRHRLMYEPVTVYVWAQRDANAVPQSVTDEVLRLAALDGSSHP